MLRPSTYQLADDVKVPVVRYAKCGSGDGLQESWSMVSWNVGAPRGTRHSYDQEMALKNQIIYFAAELDVVALQEVRLPLV